jgi:NADPH2:quinone reductase
MLSATSTTRDELGDVLALIGQGAVRPAIAEMLPLAEAARAHAALEGGRTLGRLVLRPTA